MVRVCSGPSILVGYWWSEWFLVLHHLQSRTVKESSARVCVFVKWNNEMGLSKELSYMYARLHTLIRQKKINEMLHKWRAYVHRLQHYTFVPGHVCSQGNKVLCTLSRGVRRRRRRRAWLTTLMGGLVSHRHKQGDETMQHRWRDGVLGPGTDRMELCFRRESVSESTFLRISPPMYQEQHLRRAEQTTRDSEELIPHIVNNWCASKHWRCMHTWSEYINPTCGRSVLLGSFFSPQLTLDQLKPLHSVYICIIIIFIYLFIFLWLFSTWA